MRPRPTALGWIDPVVTGNPEWDAAQVRRLGYALVWPPEITLVPLVDQVRGTDVDAVIMPSPLHMDVLMLHAVMCVVDVETATPRMSFARWTGFSSGGGDELEHGRAGAGGWSAVGGVGMGGMLAGAGVPA